MSHPIYNGGLRIALTADNRPYVLDDGNWTVVGAEPPQPVYRSLLLKVNSAEVYGFFPTWRDEPFSQAIARAGTFTRSDLLAWRGPMLAPADVAGAFVKAGFHNDYGTDAMEWGSGDPSQLDKELIAYDSVTVPVPNKAPSPNPGAAVAVFDNVTWPAMVNSSLFSTWARANVFEHNELIKYLQAVRAGTSVRAPRLTTSFGRSLVGLVEQTAWDRGVHD